MMKMRRLFSTASADHEKVIRYGLGTLKNAQHICDSISSVDYSRNLPHYYNATIGGHMRHILDHYRPVVNALIAVKPNITLLQYDQRSRDTAVEKDRLVASVTCAEYVSALSTLLNSADANSTKILDLPISLEFASDASGIPFQVQSFLGRELAFASHHGIHHLSTVRLMMETLGYTIADNSIGVAPSTLHFQSQNK